MRIPIIAFALALGACSPTAIIGSVVEGVTYAETGKSLTAHAIDWVDERSCVVEYLRSKKPREGCDHEVIKPIDDPTMERSAKLSSGT